MTTSLVVASCVLLRGVAFSSPLPIAIDVASIPAGTTVPAIVELEASDGAAPELTRTLQVPGSFVVEVRPGLTYALRVKASGYWADERVVFVDANGQSAPTHLVLWPTGTITARTSFPANTPRPEFLSARFSPPQSSTSGSAPQGETRCSLQGSTLRCEIPAGTIDVRLRAEGFVSHFFWGVGVQASKVLDLGNLDFRKGGSVVGWVNVASGSVDTKTCTIELSPLQLVDARAPAEKRALDQITILTHPTARGFFHFQGVAAGVYAIKASQPPFAPAALSPVRVFENVETELQESIVLSVPSELTVSLEPALDPQGRPWKLALFRQLEGRFESQRLPAGEPEAPERWRFMNLPEGQFSLQISDLDGTVWVDMPITIEQRVQEERITIPVVPVRGRLTLGDKSLEGVLVFGGVRGKVAIKVWTDDHGRFECTLPREGTWNVTVGSLDPTLKRDMGVL